MREVFARRHEEVVIHEMVLVFHDVLLTIYKIFQEHKNVAIIQTKTPGGLGLARQAVGCLNGMI